jgi:predicted nucleotidyltransferase
MVGPIERLLTGLSDAGVRYLVVGGVAVVLHGYLRATADLDLLIDLDQDNIEKAVAFFESEGFRPRAPVPLLAFCDRAERRRWINEKNLQVFSLWHPSIAGFEIDLFVEEPFPFAEAYARAIRVTLGSSSVTVVSIDDLIAMKRLAGRAKDAEDIDALERLKDSNDR